MHAGQFSGGALQPGRALPTLLVGAEDDAAQAPKMRALQGALEKAGWPSVLQMRPGGHALSGEDLDVALDFLASQQSP